MTSNNFFAMLMSLRYKPEMPKEGDVLYHGTSSIWAADITKNGLQPISANKWYATMVDSDFNPARDDEPGYVYLTSNLGIAKKYAKTRAAYLRTMPGGTFKWNNSKMVKDFGTIVIPNARPAVLSVTVDPRIKDAFDADPQSPHLRVGVSIPADLIKKVSRPRPAKLLTTA
jgi:hypothetical protein